MNTLEVALLRYYFTKGYTAGKMYINGRFQCYTLEDEVREVEGQEVLEWKQHGITAIPRGRYEITLRYSPKFKRQLPWLRDVPGYKYILIHSGNKVEHTEGCILVGASDGNDRDAWVGNSRVAEKQLIPVLENALAMSKRVFITVV